MQRKEVLSTASVTRNYMTGRYELRLVSVSAELRLDYVSEEDFKHNGELRRFYRVTIEEITPQQAAEEK